MKRILLIAAFGTLSVGANCDNPCIGTDCLDSPTLDAGDVDPTVDWCRVYDEVIQPSCVRCHADIAAGLSPFLEVKPGRSAAAVVADLTADRGVLPRYVTPGEADDDASYLWKRVNANQMPPDGKMGDGSQAAHDAAKKMIRDWILNGASADCAEPVDAGPAADSGPAADTGPEPDGGPPADSGPPPARTICDVFPNLTADCRSCHITNTRGSFSLGDGTALGAYNAVVLVPSGAGGMPYVTPGSQADSYLYHKLNGSHAGVPGGSGARMPTSGAWPQADIDILGDWIQEGANAVNCD
jgi:hypothetical protein